MVALTSVAVAAPLLWVFARGGSISLMGAAPLLAGAAIGAEEGGGKEGSADDGCGRGRVALRTL